MTVHGSLRDTSSAIGAGVLYFLIYSAVPQFESLFQGFAADLPLITRFAIETYEYSLLLLVLALAAHFAHLHWLGISLRSDSALRGFAARALSTSVAVTIFFVVALYVPIFKMGGAQ